MEGQGDCTWKRKAGKKHTLSNMVYMSRIEGRVLWVRVCTIYGEKYICPQRTVLQYKLSSGECQQPIYLL